MDDGTIIFILAIVCVGFLFLGHLWARRSKSKHTSGSGMGEVG